VVEFVSTDAETDLVRENESASVRNGRFLSPDSERRRKDAPRAICGFCRARRISAHWLRA